MSGFARSVALGQMESDSQKTYGADDTDFVLHQTHGKPGTVMSVKIRWVLERAIKRMSFRELQRKNCPNKRETARRLSMRRAVSNSSRGNRTPIELFACPVSHWPGYLAKAIVCL